MSSGKELLIEESREISDTKKLTSMNNNLLANNSVERTNNVEDHSINIRKRLNLKTSNVLSFLSTKPPNTCLNETALLNGCYTVTFLDLLSLEVCHIYAQMKDIKSYDKLFNPGWLHDEIINSLLFNLTKEHTEVLFCGSTEAMLIHHGKSFRKMWKNEDLTKKSLVLIPFNPTNSHWKLICINLSDATVSVLDPMVRQC